MKKMLEEGDLAPDFTMPSTFTDEFHLYRELEKGPILLYFYLGDFTPNCTIYMNKLIDAEPSWSDMGVRLIPVNPDSLDSHRKWAERLDSPYEYVHDEGQEVSKSYGAIVVNSPVTRGFTNREFFLVDGDCRIRYIWRAYIPKEMPEMDTVVSAVKEALQED